MSECYEKARAIAEAAANRWDQFSDTTGVGWLAEQIHRAIAAEPLRAVTALTFMHIDAALSVLALVLLTYGMLTGPDDAPLIPSQNALTNTVLITFVLASVCTLIIYGGWIIA